MLLHQLRIYVISCALGLLACASGLVYAASPDAPLSIIDAMKPPGVVNMRISPDGKHIAAIVRKGEATRAILLDTGTLTPRVLESNSKVLPSTNSVRWLNDSFLVISSDQWGSDIVDLKGKEVIDAGDYFIGMTDPDSAGNERFLYSKEGIKYRFNLVTRERKIIDRSNPGKPIHWLHDHQGDARVVTTINTAFWSDDTSITHWYRESVAHKWERLATFAYLDDYWDPLYFSKDDKSLVVTAREGRDTHAYFRFDLKTRKITEMMAGHPTQDIYADFDTQADDARYVLTRGIKTEIKWFDPVWEAVQRGVDAALPGAINLLDGDPKKMVLIHSYSDRDPGGWYLLDVAKATLRLVSAVKPEIDPEKMRPVQIVQYQARDGLQIPAYLTRPAGVGPKPTVIFIHGGPHARDGWNFDPEVQLLAARGYVVFQPQFRGSGGFGKRYMEAGFGQWGLSMQDDITDGVRWLVEQGHTDPARICIYGASYGGYAAMWGMVKTPELYRCGASYAGVSDLQYMLKDDSDVNARATGRLQRSMMFGSSAARKQILDDVSPLKNASRFGAPVLIAHGEWDQRVPIEHSKKMVQALKKNNKEVEWMILREEGHGIYHQRNQEKFYQALFKLFDTTIGPQAPAGAAAR